MVYFIDFDIVKQVWVLFVNGTKVGQARSRKEMENLAQVIERVNEAANWGRRESYVRS